MSVPAPLTEGEAEALAARLVEEMSTQWRHGQRPQVEDFLARHPALREHPEAVADLIFEEFCQRQEHGAEVPVAQVLARFPQWQEQLQVLFDCQRVLGAHPVAPVFPAAGDTLGDFLLQAELGRGAQGRVFVARQLSLGGRPVVLKVTPLEASEHLSLARLQHTHIVPLYCVQDDPARGLRALCMPYFGGATLAQVLEYMPPTVPAQWTGQALVRALDDAQAGAPLAPPAQGPVRAALARASYVEAICWIGACLADGLHYAHTRNLVHLDLKPSNVLLAADGQPMLLDFHLARAPLQPGAEGPPNLGGTAGYMSPEQLAAVLAAHHGRSPTLAVDARSDLYSLGLVLYEALAGHLPQAGEPHTPLPYANSAVSVGLADILGKCLAREPADRYPDLAALATDLRRHLAHRPLAGVRNRSLRERWRKWHQRRPHGLALAGMLTAVFLAAAVLVALAGQHWSEQVAQARAALQEGQLQLARGEWQSAQETLQHGLDTACALPLQADLADALRQALAQAEQVRAAADRAAARTTLRELADRVRLLYGVTELSPNALPGVATCCRDFWQERAPIVAHLRPEQDRDTATRADFLDVAIFWADLQVRLAPPADKDEARRAALRVLAQAEELFGPSPVLVEERRAYGDLVASPPPRAETAWEHYALSRALLRAGNLPAAAREAEQAVRLEPRGLWPNFYHGLCAYQQGRFLDALTAYSTCIGAAPVTAPCFFNRALAYHALGHAEQALSDYDQALRLDPTLGAAFLNRGLLHLREGRCTAALADLLRARELGADSHVLALALAPPRPAERPRRAPVQKK